MHMKCCTADLAKFTFRCFVSLDRLERESIAYYDQRLFVKRAVTFYSKYVSPLVKGISMSTIHAGWRKLLIY